MVVVVVQSWFHVLITVVTIILSLDAQKFWIVTQNSEVHAVTTPGSRGQKGQQIFF
jgi:hypothetical protein